MEELSGRGSALSLVLDASATLAWFAGGPDVREASVLLDSVMQAGAWVPSLWKLEVANALHFSAMHGRREASFVSRSLADLETLPIAIDNQTEARAWSETLELARRHRLTLYDAAYLELAVRLALPLASLDRELRAAAEADGVLVLGE
ncbi:MAG TPA: type II toxin-antitoxin system VapC family toxin [Acidobacteriaceae bacterium]|nr:type II toxin-antitoxin system VapC family toxin [Acidobacteriaceae bacterium]